MMLRHLSGVLAGKRTAPAAGSVDLPSIEAEFARRGVVTLPGILTAAEVAALNDAIDLDRAQHADEWGDPAQVGGAAHRFQSVQILKNSASFDGVIRHPRLWPIIQRLMGPSVAFDEYSVMVREACPDAASMPSPTGGAAIHEQGWHRDGGYTNYLPQHRFCLHNLSLVLLLDDCDENSHTFSVLPESVETKRSELVGPLRGVSWHPGQEHEAVTTASPELPDDPALARLRRGEAEDCIGPAGTAVLMNTGSAHAGTVRQTPRCRRTIHIYYGHDYEPPISIYTAFLHSRLLPSSADVETRRFFSRQTPRRVMVLGDSIRASYEDFIHTNSNFRSNVSGLSGWCDLIPTKDIQGGDSRNILAVLDEKILCQNIDILQLNCGLHDCSRGGEDHLGFAGRPQIPLEEYQRPQLCSAIASPCKTCKTCSTPPLSCPL
jgi:hypothetical protein